MITRKILVFIALISVVFSLNNTSIYLPVPEEIPKLNDVNITPTPYIPPIPPVADCKKEYSFCLNKTGNKDLCESKLEICLKNKEMPFFFCRNRT